MVVSASAPGKLVLVGEYAVLHGYPAAVAAVDRRARVDLAPSATGCSSVTAPGLVPYPVELDVGPDGACSWVDPAGRLPLVEGLLGAMGRARLLKPTPIPFAARLDTTAFFLEEKAVRCKLGLGSSAALSVALASALMRWGETAMPAAPREWLRTLVALHRDIQGGRGSGVDVAAAHLGGVVGYRLAEAGEAPLTERLSLPDDLRLVFVWTGRSADTSVFLAGLEDARRRDPAAVEDALSVLGAVSESTVAALRAADMRRVLAGVDDFCAALADLGSVAGLSILSAEHSRLRELVAAHGGSYKPSGAGGGDVGIAFTAGVEGAAAVSRAVAAAGFRVLDLGIATEGLELRSA